MSEVTTTNIGNWVEDQEFLGNEDKSAGDLERPITMEDFVHVGPGTINGRFLRRFWHPVLPARMLEPGHARPMRRLGEDFTLYRGETGTFHTVANRCAHRATQLSTGWVEGDCIRCFYHGWMYLETGQCVEQPDENERFKTKIKIRSYPTKEYLGLVFVYFGEDTPPELPRYKLFEDPEGILTTRGDQTWPCSYWGGQENDAFHVNWVHRDTLDNIGRRGKISVSCEETEYGFAETQTNHYGMNRESVQVTHHIVPNIRLRWNGRSNSQSNEDPNEKWSETMRFSVPVDDDHFDLVGVAVYHNEPAEEQQRNADMRPRRMVNGELIVTEVGLSHLRSENQLTVNEIGDGVLRGDWTLHDFPGRDEENLESLESAGTRLFNAQDYVAQVGQGVASMLHDEHLGRTDVQIAMWRRLYRRELTALARGEKLTNWTLPDKLTVLVSDGEVQKNS